MSVTHQELQENNQLNEKHAFLRLLATWVDNEQIVYPITYKHVDKPDFLVRFNKRNMGIEHTNAITQNSAHFNAVAHEEGISGCYFVDPFRRDAPKLTRKKARDILRNTPLGGVGFGDDGFEKEWALCIMDSILKKTGAISKPDFIKYDENFLLIFDNLHVIIRNVDTTMKYLNQELTEYGCQDIRFDKIFIDCNIGCMIEIDCTNRSYQAFNRGKVK